MITSGGAIVSKAVALPVYVKKQVAINRQIWYYANILQQD